MRDLFNFLSEQGGMHGRCVCACVGGMEKRKEGLKIMGAKEKAT